VTCRVWSPHTGAAEDSCLLRHYAMSLGKWILTSFFKEHCVHLQGSRSSSLILWLFGCCRWRCSDSIKCQQLVTQCQRDPSQNIWILYVVYFLWHVVCTFYHCYSFTLVRVWLVTNAEKETFYICEGLSELLCPFSQFFKCFLELITWPEYLMFDIFAFLGSYTVLIGS
jgi:hypothetical protein